MKFDLIDKSKSIVELIQGKLSKKQFIYVSCVLVGLSAGLAAIVLKTFVHFIFTSLESFGNSKYFLALLPLIGVLLTVLLIKKVLNNNFDKGLAHLHNAVIYKSSRLPKQQMYAQILTSSLTVGFGGSAGLEAPIVITGASIGTNYSDTYKLTDKDRTLLLACGIAAGIAAAFNAPIAGVLFALEVLLMNISIASFTPLILAAASGALISKIILEDGILLSFQLQQPFNYANVPFYILLGLLSGLVSVYHSRVFTKVERLFHFSTKNPWVNALIGGLVLAVLIVVFPSLFGEGYQSIKMLSQENLGNFLDQSILNNFKNNQWFVIVFIGSLIFVKVIATAITIGSGGNGGNFAPSLFVGAYLGFFFSRLLNMFGMTNLPETNFTIVGMAGVLSGLYHAPLTAIFLIAEITGGYTLMIPLMIVSSISFAISKNFEPFSMDTKKLGKKGKVLESNLSN